ncbi:MAG TPA: cob(I)yrinic acid a,c-diamide adenosyltransferase [Clostridia bacterium]|nr:cob(I)yrinic acid a,c-diamide adenosyltransferase [Clostridia bacterium]
MRGLVHIYTGDGKGKTTAAVGLGVRACGQGLRVLMVQFLKAMPTGEVSALKALEPSFNIHRGSSLKKFTFEMNDQEKATTAAEQQDMLEYASREAAAGKCDMLILDEAFGAVSSGMLSKDKLIELVKNKPDNLELIMTGRNAPQELVEMADYVSEIRAVKHPSDKGTGARKGIEF